jgi:hypothetical protein
MYAAFYGTRPFINLSEERHTGPYSNWENQVNVLPPHFIRCFLISFLNWYTSPTDVIPRGLRTELSGIDTL